MPENQLNRSPVVKPMADGQAAPRGGGTDQGPVQAGSGRGKHGTPCTAKGKPTRELQGLSVDVVSEVLRTETESDRRLRRSVGSTQANRETCLRPERSFRREW